MPPLNSMRALERSVCEATQEILEEYSEFLASLGLTAVLEGIDVFDAHPQRRTSEVRIYFYGGRNLADAFEFFVLRDGEPLVSVYEVQEWLREQIEALPELHGRGTGVDRRGMIGARIQGTVREQRLLLLVGRHDDRKPVVLEGATRPEGRATRPETVHVS
ncbi:MAG TPA: hypothetical protein VF192_01915 [Longimicrobiales bacterium]